MANVFRATATFRLPNGDTALPSLWFEVDPPIGSVRGGTVGQALWNAVWNSYKARCVGATVFGGTTTDQVDIDSGVVLGRAGASSTVVGTGPSNTLPPDVAVCISLRTEIFTRSGRGRSYLPAPNISSVATNGNMLPVVATDALAGVAAGLAAMRALEAGTNLIVYSRTRHEVYPVVTAAVGDHWDTQRRRDNSLPEGYTTQALTVV